MKKKFFTYLGSAMLVAPLTLVLACSNEKNSDITIKEKTIGLNFKTDLKKADKSIVSVMTDPENPRWVKADQWIAASGAKAFKDVTHTIIKEAVNQATWLNTNISKGDAVFVGMTDNTIAQSFKDVPKEKPIIAFDKLIKTNNRSAYNWYVTYDSKAVGKLQGIAILSDLYGTSFTGKTDDEIVAYVKEHKLSDKKIIAAVGGDPADNNADLFYNGAMDLIKKAMAEDSNLVVPEAFNTFEKVGQPKWDYAAGQTFLQTKITQLEGDKSKVAAILSPNDGMATSAINALKQNNLDPKKVFITGLDANDTAIKSLYLDTGQNMTIYKPDEVSTAVMIALASYLIDHPADNAIPTSEIVGHYPAITEYIQSAFTYKDGSKIDFKITSDEYSSTDDQGQTANFYVNTILLTPNVIDANNYSEFFDVDDPAK